MAKCTPAVCSVRFPSWLILGSLLLFASTLLAQAPIRYDIAFPNAVHHEAEISVTFTDLPRTTLELRMSRSSPGRYALHEFAKNVYNVRATDGRGNRLAISRPDPYQWNVAEHTGTVKVSYTLFADHADGTYAGIDETHAHLNIPPTFMWARGLEQRPIEVHFTLPPEKNWKIATQLEPTNRPNVFRAPNFQYFMDSPIELSNYTERAWQVRDGDRTQTIRLVLHHDGTEAEADAYAEMTKAVVLEQQAIFGELPRFDFGTYTFLIDYLPYVAGDGMEHRNSTVITSTRSLRAAASRNIGTVAHEFFHAWNVERIRPQSLEPFDFERANMSGELCFAEGFTSYYTPLTLVRAGIISTDKFAQDFSFALSYVLNSPGRNYFSPVEMSMQAPFVDAATAVDRDNQANTFISYYTYGMVIGLGLDLSLRARDPNLDLDTYMRAVWQKFGKPEKPYTIGDLQSALAEVTGDAGFARDFFARYVHGRELVDYEKLLARAGFVLQKARPSQASWGYVRLRYRDNTATVDSPILIGTPLYAIGMNRGAVITSIAGQPPASAEAVRMILAAHKPGDTVEIAFEQRGLSKRLPLTLAADPSLEVVLFEHVSKEISPEMEAFRQRWLSSKAANLPQLHRHCHSCGREFPFAHDFCLHDGAELQLTPKSP